MKLLVDIDNVSEEIELIEHKDTKEWSGYVNGHKNDQDFYLKVVQANDNDQPIVTLGARINTSQKYISEQFKDYLLKRQIDRLDSENSGIEDTEEEQNDEINPYDPELIRVDPRYFNLSYIHELINSEENELDLSPAFQRNFVWNDITRKSRLIESLLLRIPIPVFYFAQDDDGKFKVIDGLQRLTVINSFLNNKFKLKNLEYLKECEGNYFRQKNSDKPGLDYLDGKYVRRIHQTQILCNIIDPQTPSKVKFDIFKRINTGGKSLNPQEIRNCLANNNVRSLLQKLANSEEFITATGNSISSTRMADQELVLRYIGFYYFIIKKDPNLKYKGNMNQFLDNVINRINIENETILSKIKDDFLNSMKNAHYLFGEYAFRKCKSKHLQPNSRKQLLNKSLFITISILLSAYPHESVNDKYDSMTLTSIFAEEIENNTEYYDVLTNATNDNKRLSSSFITAKKLIKGMLGDYND